MKKGNVISLFLILCSVSSFGQILPVRQGPYPVTKVIKVKQPLLIIGSLETNYSSLIIDRNNLEIVKEFKDSLELKPFGEKGHGGVVLARLKTQVPLLRLEEVLDYYQVPTTNRKLRVLVNKSLINPNLFLADVTRIEKIEKIKQDLTSPVLYSLNKDEEYLNIVTVKE